MFWYADSTTEVFQVNSKNKIAIGRPEAIVIGAGVAGLASSIRLSAKGYKVRVFESRAEPGGKIGEIRSNGFRFDAGPSLFTMPELVDELFDLANSHEHDSFEYIQLDEICRYFYEDGTRLTAGANVKDFARQAEEATGVDSTRVLKHLKKSQFIYETTGFIFLERSLHKLKSYLSLKVLVSMLKLPFLGISKSMHQANQHGLQNDKMAQLFNRYATYNGSNPYIAPGVLNIIPHLEFGKGAFFPKGGMISIRNALFKLAVSMGVEFQFNTLVSEIVVEDKKAVGVKVEDEFYPSIHVVCNMDVFYAYSKLLPNFNLSARRKQQERSSSAIIFYWGVEIERPELGLHNILFTKDSKREFEDLFCEKNLTVDPTIYINITSKLQQEDAPANCENWFVMVNAPSNEGQDWDAIIDRARETILQKINRVIGIDVREHILTEEILDPRTIDTKTMSYQGSLYGTSSNSKFSAFFRHPNFSKEIGNLYFCGGSVHPGGGIPLALSSAKIVDQLIPSAK